MRIVGATGFVLHARPWRETSLLVEVLSADHGRVGLLARGVHGPRRQLLRAALQPLQHIRFDAVQRGELATLARAEALDAAPRLEGERMLAGFYLNELMLRLAPRNDAQPELYALYAATRRALAGEAVLAWTLRRFERDLLEAMGLGFAFDVDGDGAPIDAAARYRLDPEQGPRRLLGDRGRSDREQAATGAALLALASDAMPRAEDMAALRRVLRGVLLHHLGGRGLKSWELLGQLGGVTQRAAEARHDRQETARIAGLHPGAGAAGGDGDGDVDGDADADADVDVDVAGVGHGLAGVANPDQSASD